MATGRERESPPRSGGVPGVVDRGLYALFARHAEDGHARDRRRFRAANRPGSFDRYLVRVYGLSWLVGTLAATLALVAALLVPPATLDAALAGTPLAATVPVRLGVAAVAGSLVGLLAKAATVRAGGLRLRWAATARRSDIERTLPGAVRYLRALATGSDDRERMLRKVAERDAYGETGVAFERVLSRAALSGSLDAALRETARDTPSRDLLSPFLLKFREHASQGSEALGSYLRMESRMLSHRQDRARQRAGDFLELLAELFIVLLVLPALLVVVLTVVSVLAPGLSTPIPTPVGTTTPRAVAVYGAAAFALLVGAGAAALVADLRPAAQAAPSYERPGGLATLASVGSNPASAAVAFLPVGLLAAAGLFAVGAAPENAVLLGYAAYGIPVGLVAVRRARRDDAKDRELKDFVHAVAGRMSLGRPFPAAVAAVAEEVDNGALQSDVADLAFTLSLTSAGGEGDTRRAALERFTDAVGTPLAAQTTGLVTGALDVGGEAEEVFDALQQEVGRLHHARKSLRSSMLVYVAVGWTTALLIVGIVLAVNAHVLDGFAQLSSVSGTSGGVAIDPRAVDIERDRRRFYVVTQATMLACGWFAGVASRDRYEALLHSGALVVVCYLTFSVAGMGP
ncbi:type II secretion system F family protein [Halosegnis marinus]|uniref:Type II secretion system F family protein n=1 Tax=Halosegnis marinus TaxID=3034023 RepID=A0ABD5ZMZ5_9EURY|nr:type II secretion system F family protein [Halosegnis sp. DT85]